MDLTNVLNLETVSRRAFECVVVVLKVRIHFLQLVHPASKALIVLVGQWYGLGQHEILVAEVVLLLTPFR